MPYICFVRNIYFSLYPLLNDTDIEDMKRIRASQTILNIKEEIIYTLALFFIKSLIFANCIL